MKGLGLPTAVIYLGVLISSVVVNVAPAHAEQAKWFVIREETTSNCWTALLIQVDGKYVHGSANLAGGPFETKEQALAREQELEKNGSCGSGS
jgi:hypothetical protein